MNATDVLQTEPAAMHSRDAAGDDAPDARARGSHMTIRHLGTAPSIHPDAYVAPTAVLSGQVSIGAGSCTCTARSWPPRAARSRSAPAA